MLAQLGNDGLLSCAYLECDFGPPAGGDIGHKTFDRVDAIKWIRNAATLLEDPLLIACGCRDAIDELEWPPLRQCRADILMEEGAIICMHELSIGHMWLTD